MRAFLAISLPEDVTDALGDLQARVRNARWVDEENMHLTLAFLGDCTPQSLREMDTMLATMRAESFDLTLHGAGGFGGATPRLIYADVAPCPPLRRLQAKVERIARDCEIEVERRKFVPHVTIARCGGGVIPAEALGWIARNNLFRAGPIPVRDFALYQSQLGTGAPVYTELARYPLAS